MQQAARSRKASTSLGGRRRRPRCALTSSRQTPRDRTTGGRYAVAWNGEGPPHAPPASSDSAPRRATPQPAPPFRVRRPVVRAAAYRILRRGTHITGDPKVVGRPGYTRTLPYTRSPAELGHRSTGRRVSHGFAGFVSAAPSAVQ
jgi:hypothetical protein